MMSATTPVKSSLYPGNSGSVEAGRRIPGDGHMWFMVLGDLVIFGAYFIIYMFDRGMSPEAYVNTQRLLSVDVGVVNTIVLLTSSLFAALAVIYTRHGSPNTAIRMVYATGICGVLFALTKVYEWHHMAQYASIHDEFISYYYVLTMTHLFHVFVGLVVLGIVVKELRNPRKRRLEMVEQGVLFWHMVDVIWLFIFPMLYLM
jgi:nitric oxide reductase NorE protein